MTTIFYSNLNSPLGNISFTWLREPTSKIISIDLPKHNTESFNPESDNYIKKFSKKVLSEKNIRFEFIAEEKKYPSFVQLLLKEIHNYFYGTKQIKYSLEYFSFENVTDFSNKVLKILYTVPIGKLISYKELAEKADSPKAFRAIGSIMNKNPYPLVIPCHRVIKNDKTIGGFAPGTEMKKKLLEHENVYNNIIK